MSGDKNWTIEESRGANFGDERLNKRYGSLLNLLSSSPNKSIPGACKSWKETLAAYRFFNHPRVTEAEILAPHEKATLERIKREKIVLIPQDTSELDYSQRKEIAGMGYLRKEASQGFYVHPSIAITPERSCLGVINMQSWSRKELGKRRMGRKEKKGIPIEAKESHCWLKGYEAANQIAIEASNTLVVSVADREGDLIELLTKMPSESNRAYWLIRSNYNREIQLEDPEAGIRKKMREAMREKKAEGEIEFELPPGRVQDGPGDKKKRRRARQVKQAIRFSTIEIKPPKEKKEYGTVRLQVIHCCEVDPPAEEEKIEWFLLTSYPVSEIETALEVVGWYLTRWMIEVFFKILKSGCQVEELQFESLAAMRKCIAFYLIVAWRILYVTMLGRACPEMPCDMVFESEEWQSVYVILTKKPPPSQPPKLNDMVKMIARLGGFLERKSDGEPGPQVMWIGIQRMRDFALAWETFQPIIREKSYV